MIDFSKIIVQRIIVLLLFLIFVYWSTGAVLKYLDEPATTNIHFTLGDTEDGIQFPGCKIFYPKRFQPEYFIPEIRDFDGVKLDFFNPTLFIFK